MVGSGKSTIGSSNFPLRIPQAFKGLLGLHEYVSGAQALRGTTDRGGDFVNKMSI